MPRYELFKDAEQDLDNILSFGIERFGVEQAIRYYDGLEQHFEVLAEQPYLYPAIDYIREGYRRNAYEVHAVYYRVIEDGVEIMAVIGKQDFTARNS